MSDERDGKHLRPPESLESVEPVEPTERVGDADAPGEEAVNPFDHPAFLPVLMTGLALWFGFDGWFNESIESVDFNRFGFGFLAGAAVYFTLAEYTRIRFLLPALFALYTLWLYLVGFVAAEDAFAADPSGVLFARYAALFTAGGALWATGLELTGSRWLLPLLFVGYAGVMAALPPIGSESSWWNAHEWTAPVHDIGAIACLVVAVALGIRAALRGGGGTPEERS